MNLESWAKTILLGDSLTDKLLPLKELDRKSLEETHYDYSCPLLPGRPKTLRISESNVKFPKKNKLHQQDERAKAIHFFANHELLAIEIMAHMLLSVKGNTPEILKFKTGLLSTLSDEQKHLKLYCNRMEELGLSFGDIEVNDYFWEKMRGITNIEEYLAVMALTFESANLDFASYYRDLFEEYGDHESSNILDQVYKDEISHVAFGAFWMSKKTEKSLWDYYRLVLPEPLTPARAKGQRFDSKGRIAAGLGVDFVKNLEEYKDDFSITHRRQWKS